MMVNQNRIFSALRRCAPANFQAAPKPFDGGFLLIHEDLRVYPVQRKRSLLLDQVGQFGQVVAETVFFLQRQPFPIIEVQLI